MERTKKPNEVISDKPWWKKEGGGSLRIGKRIIKPNEKFQADPDEISDAFRKFVTPLSGNTGFKAPKFANTKGEVAAQVKAAKPVYTIQPHGKSQTWFDVVDENGKVQNEKSLKKEVAEQFVESLNG
jgi:hypothetical protein